MIKNTLHTGIRRWRNQTAPCALLRYCRVPISTALLLGLSSPGLALADEPAQNSGLEEIIVTSNKRRETIQDVPMNVQALSAKRLEEQHIQDFTDYTQFLPSVSVQPGGGGVVPGGSGNWRVMMRGISADSLVNYGGTLPTVGTYLDDQPITTITGAVDVHIYDVERIESLAGPQGTLYGASSEAGTVRIITAKPDTSDFYGAFNVKGVSVDHGGSGYTVEGFVNAPLSDNVAVRLVAWDVRTPGYIDNTAATRTFPTSGACIANHSPAPTGCTTSSDTAKKDFNTTDLSGGRGALKIDLDDNWTVTPTIMGQVTQTRGAFGYDPAVGYLDVNRFYRDKSSDKWWDAALTVEGKISDFDVTYSGAYLQRHDNIHTDYSDYSLAYDVASGYGSLIKNNAGQTINPSQQLTSNVNYEKISNELRVTTPLDLPVHGIVGLFQQRQVNDVTADFQIPGLAQSSWVTGYPDTWWLTTYHRVDEDLAAFGEVSWDIIPKVLTVTAGARVFNSTNSLAGFAGTHNVYSPESTCFTQSSPPGISAPCTNFAASVHQNGATPKVNITYHITPEAMVYFTYAEGFRPGGVNRQQGAPPYSSDTLISYEAGWKTSWLDNRIRFNGDVFLEDWNKFQFSFLGSNGLLLTANGGEAQVKGLESDLSADIVHGLTLTGAFALMDPKLTQNYCGTLDANFNPITNCAHPQAYAGTQLPLTNKFKGNLQVRYNFLVGDDMTGHIQGSYVYMTSERLDLRDEENSLLGGRLPAYGTADFTIGIERGQSSMELYINNAFSSHGVSDRYTQCPVTVCANPAVRPGQGGIVYNTPITPRTIGIQFGQKF